MQRDTANSVAQLVQPARVHRSVYTDPAIFRLELQHIFGAARHDRETPRLVRGKVLEMPIQEKPIATLLSWKPFCASALLLYRQDRSSRRRDAADLGLNRPVATGQCRGHLDRDLVQAH